MKLPSPDLRRKVDDVLRNMMPFAVMRKWTVPSGGGSPPVRGNFVKKQGGGTTTAMATTGGSNTVMLLCISCANGDNPVVSGNDSAGNTAATWNAGLIINQVDGTSSNHIRVFALINGAGSATHTVPTTAGGADILFLVEYTNATGIEVTNAVTGVTTGGNADVSTSATTTVANSIIFTFGAADTGTTPVTSLCTAATVFSSESDFGTYYGAAVADETVASVGVKTETWSASPAANRYNRGITCIKGT